MTSKNIHGSNSCSDCGACGSSAARTIGRLAYKQPAGHKSHQITAVKNDTTSPHLIVLRALCATRVVSGVITVSPGSYNGTAVSVDVTDDTPASTKHLYNICAMLDQRQRRWADVAQMLYKCFFVCRDAHLNLWCHFTAL